MRTSLRLASVAAATVGLVAAPVAAFAAEQPLDAPTIASVYSASEPGYQSPVSSRGSVYFDQQSVTFSGYTSDAPDGATISVRNAATGAELCSVSDNGGFWFGCTTSALLPWGQTDVVAVVKSGGQVSAPSSVVHLGLAAPGQPSPQIDYSAPRTTGAKQAAATPTAAPAAAVASTISTQLIERWDFQGRASVFVSGLSNPGTDLDITVNGQRIQSEQTRGSSLPVFIDNLKNGANTVTFSQSVNGSVVSTGSLVITLHRL